MWDGPMLLVAGRQAPKEKGGCFSPGRVPIELRLSHLSLIVTLDPSCHHQLLIPSSDSRQAPDTKWTLRDPTPRKSLSQRQARGQHAWMQLRAALGLSP